MKKNHITIIYHVAYKKCYNNTKNIEKIMFSSETYEMLKEVHRS